MKHSKNYFLILSAVSVSSVGDWLYRLALPIAVLELTKSSNLTAIMYVLEYIPYIILGPISGTIADKYSRKKLLVYSDSIAAFIAFMLVWVVGRNGVHFSYFLFLGGMLACSQVFFHPALQGLIQSSVLRSELSSINSKMQTVEGVFNTIGPALGATITAVLGVKNAILLDALSFIGAVGIFIFVRTSIKMSDRVVNKVDIIEVSIFESLHFLKNNKGLFYGVLLMGGTNFGLMAMESNIIYVTSHLLNQTNLISGIILSCGGIGTIIGSSIAVRLQRRIPTGKLVVYSMMGSGLSTVLMFLNSWLYLSLMWAADCGMISIIIVAWMTYQQQRVPQDVLGRVTAIGRMISFFAIPIGAFAGGLVTGRLQSLLALALVAGISQMIVALIGRLSPLWKLRGKSIAN